MKAVARTLTAMGTAAILAVPSVARAASPSVSIEQAVRDADLVTVAGTASAAEVSVAIAEPGLDPVTLEYASSAIPDAGGAWSVELDASAIDRVLAAYARVCLGEECSFATRDLEAVRTVVAVIEGGGTNPYHEFFNAGGSLYGESAPSSVTPEVLEELGIDEDHIIRITRTGDFEADYAADRDQFAAIRRGEPYWFEGTNLIGISFSGNEGQRLRPDGGGTHPVGTSAAVLTANPEAIVVSVEAPSAPLGVPGFATIPLGEEWAFSHPSVDFITTSYGPPGSPPLGYHLNDSYTGVVENGKLHMGASDNSPALSPVDATSGPWWTIGVSGFGEHSSEGRSALSGTAPDVIADWTQTLPYCKGCEEGTSTVSGTSFASPRTAGTTSKIVLEARRAAGHGGGIRIREGEAPVMVEGNGLSLTNWEVRRALEEAAYYPTIGDWSPGQDPPIPDAAPWTLAGWGVVTPDPEHEVIPEALAHLGVGGEPTRTKGPDACAYMTANIHARRAWWNAVAPFSQSNGNLDDPYEYCSPV